MKESDVEPNNTISILIVEDHPLVREGLNAVLSYEHDFCVVGEAENGVQAVLQYEKLQPDIVLMDLLMPEMDGSEAIRIIHNKNPEQKIIILTSVDNIKILQAVVRAGASGYVSKNAKASELIKTIRAVYSGSVVLPMYILQSILADTVLVSPKNGIETLTTREQEVLRLLGQGLNNDEIGNKLFISPSTVSVHTGRILHKLGLRNRAQLALFCLQNKQE